ncbi:MAG: rhodanese-related sulfurtransferase [Pseudomonadota bacterium]
MLTVAALYHFTRFPDPAALRGPLIELCQSKGVKGSLLLAIEGINGTIAGPDAGIAAVLAALRKLPGCEALEHKQSYAAKMPFRHLKIKLKREIVTMGQPDIDPVARVGHYVAPKDWNALIAEPDVVMIDTRNDYETGIGSFQGAVDPDIRTFRDFPAWWEQHKDEYQGKRIAMFCTGGIRCEKSTNYLLGQGVDQVYHLKGGILKYLEDVPAAASMWNGECYVFDTRVSVGHGLVPGDYDSCHACRRPISAADKLRPEYERGACCHQCAAEYSEADRDRFRERQRQLDLARARGEAHFSD